MKEKPSGYGLMQIAPGNESLPFHVGFNQGEVFAGLPNRRGEDGQPLSVKAYGELFSPARLQANELSAADVRDFVYSALVSGHQIDGLEVGFTPSQVGLWIDDAETDEVMKPLREMVAQLIKRIERTAERAKNALAPTSNEATGLTKTPRDLVGLG